MAASVPTPPTGGSDQLIATLVDKLAGIHAGFRSHGALDWHGIAGIVDPLLTLIPPAPEPVPALRAWGEYDEAHAINTAVYTLSMARAFGFSGAQRRDLGLAAILHDIGKIIPQNHPKKIELGQIDTHGAVGWALLSEMVDVLPRIALWVRDHHERIDGSGPHGLKDPALETQLIAMADIYDANLTPHPRRATLSSHAAWNVAILAATPRLLPEVVAAFKAHVQPYPPGSHVRLTGGARAVVITPPPPENPLAPVIRSPEGQAIDLAQYAAPRVAMLARP